MRRASFNFLMLILSFVGAGVAYILGEILLVYMAYLPYWLQCGIYLLFICCMCCLVMYISEKIRSGRYLLKHKQEFNQTARRAALIMLPLALILGIVTQLLYSLVGFKKTEKPNFQGTMILCDISGSMLENDAEQEAIKAIIQYIDTVPLGEYLGVTVFNSTPYEIRKYTVLKTEAERSDIKEIVDSGISYAGGTDIQSALMTSFSQMRSIGNGNWPGLILLFSDGLSDLDYDEIQRASIGDIDKLALRIPVNTIFFSKTPFDGYQMSTIAQKTGGTYFYKNVNDNAIELRDVFTHSRTIFTVEKPNLIKSYFGISWNSVLRIILQVIFITLWGLFTGILTIVFLNNKRLIKDYLYFKIGVSLVVAVIFALLLISANIDKGILVRALLAAGMCIIYLPTYDWDSFGDKDGIQGFFSIRQ